MPKRYSMEIAGMGEGHNYSGRSRALPKLHSRLLTGSGGVPFSAFFAPIENGVRQAGAGYVNGAVADMSITVP